MRAVWRSPVSPAPASSASTATMGAAAKAICSPDCAARLDQASRLKLADSLLLLSACMRCSPYGRAACVVGPRAERDDPKRAPMSAAFAPLRRRIVSTTYGSRQNRQVGEICLRRRAVAYRSPIGTGGWPAADSRSKFRSVTIRGKAPMPALPLFPATLAGSLPKLF